MKNSDLPSKKYGIKNLHYAWIICLGCEFMMFCCNGIIFNVFSVFLPFIKHSFALSNTQFSVMITCRSLSSLLAISLCGRYYRHLSLRKGMFLASMICVAALLCYSLAGSYRGLLAAAILSGLGYGLGTNVPIAMMLGRWFAYRRNFAMSLVSLATSIALVGFPSAVTWLVGKYSLGSALTCVTVLDFCVAAAGISLLRNHPDDLGLLPYGESEVAGGDHERDTVQPVESTKKRLPARMLRSRGVTKADWLLLGPAVLLLGAVAWTAAGYMTVLLDSMGVRPQLIAISMTVYGMSLLLAKLIYGWLTDIFGSYLCNWFYCLMLILGCVLMCLGCRFPLAVWLGSAALGIGMTVSIVGLVAWAGDLGTQEQYNTLIQRFQFLLTAGGILYTTVPGVIADHAGGSYIPAYMILAVFSMLFTAAIQLLYYRKMQNT